MLLNRNEIKSILTGILEVHDDGTGLIPLRSGKLWREALAEVPHYERRSCQSASVTLDLCTDASGIRIDLDGWREPDDRIFCVDVLENNVLTGSFFEELPLLEGKDYVPVERKTLSFTLSPGEKRVTVVFPWILVARIRAVELEGGTLFRPYTPKRYWIAFGDSITHGAYAKCPSMTYVNQLARLMDAHVLNHGIGGERFFGRNLVPGTYPKCDFVTIAYGTNDYRNGTREEFDREMPEFLRRAAAEFPNTPIFVILPLWRLQEGQGKIWEMGRTLEEVRSCIRQEAAKYPNMYLVEGAKLVPHLPEFYGDKFLLHPSDLGFSQYAMNLYREILPVLKEWEDHHGSAL